MTESEDRYFDLARRIGDGDEVDWDREQSSVGDTDAALLKNLQRVAELAGSQRGMASAEDARRGNPAPRTVGDYTIYRQLGAGGLGLVYEAQQENPRRSVALKVIRGQGTTDPEVVRLFQREARTLARLRHPAIASIYESGCAETGEHFIAMELVRGEKLNEWRARRNSRPGASRDELRVRLQLFRKICDAVGYAHQRGVTHRDLKPSNILLVEQQSSQAIPHVKLLDFGLAHAAFTTGVTEPGRIRGTVPYMSPEQTRGNPDEIDARTDIYSLGVILYELLTDKRPYDVESGGLSRIARAIRSTPPRPLADVWPGSSRPDPELEGIVGRVLEKRPANRYQSIFGIVEAIDHYLERSHRGHTVPSWVGRVPWLGVGLALLILYGALMTGLFLRTRSRLADASAPTPAAEQDER